MNFSKNDLRILSVLLLIAMLLSGMSAFAERATVNAKTYAYKQPDTGSASVKVKKGAVVEIIDVEGSWAKVEKDGKTAFMATKYLDVQEEDEKDAEVSFKEYDKPIAAEVNAKTYAFKKPDADSAAIKVKKGTKLDVLGTSGEWAKVEKDGNVAYMYAKYLDKASSSEKEDEKKPEMTVK